MLPSISQLNNFLSLYEEITYDDGYPDWKGLHRRNWFEDDDEFLYDHDIANDIQKHDVYIFLVKNKDYQRAIQTFRRQKFYKRYVSNKAGILAELHFHYICMSELKFYLEIQKQKVFVFSKKDRGILRRRIQSLINAIPKEDVYPDPLTSGIHDLRRTLQLSINDLDNNESSLTPKTNKGWVPQRIFIQRLGLSFDNEYGTFFPTIIEHILRMAECDYIGRNVIDDSLKKAKSYKKYTLEGRRPNKKAYFKNLTKV
jgi:hypothetical protein